MDNGRTAAIPLPVVLDAVYDRSRDRMLATMWPATPCGDTPGTGCEPPLTDCVRSTRNPTLGAVVIGELDVLIYFQPALVPAPQRRAVYAALPSGDTNWHIMLDHEAYRLGSRFW
jgi:hypothetical protein